MSSSANFPSNNPGSSHGGGGIPQQPATVVTSSALSKAAAAQANAFWQKQPKANAELFALTYGALVAELVRDIEDPAKITEELDRMGHSIGIRCIEEVLSKASTADYAASLLSAGGSSGPSGTSVGSSHGGPGPDASHPTSIVSRSQSFPESSEILKIALRMFLGLVVETVAMTTTTSQIHSHQHPPSPSYAIRFLENPLAIFVELPEEYRGSTTSSSNNNKDASTSANNSRLEYSQLLAGMCRGMLEMLHLDCHCYISQSVLMGGDINEIVVELKQVLQDGAGEDYHEE